ncbi:MAG: glycosyltransferase [bacterium]|nr:glycosyltransferase [bacterium]
MKLTVVIPSRDKLPLLQRTLAALWNQDLPAENWNVVVVDDDSHDGTGAWLAEESARRQGRLTVVAPPSNVGRAAARNLGARAATAEAVLFLDDDIVAPPGLLSAHLAILAQHPGDGTIGLVRTAPDVLDAPHFHYLDTRGVAKTQQATVPARYLVTQNTGVPRAAFLAIGGFDESFRAYGFEDMDLGFRLEDAGVRFRPLRDPVPEHVHHHTLDQWLAKKRECGHGPLQHLARRHPHRLREMRLDLLFAPGGQRPETACRLARGPVTVLAAALRSLALRWPCGDGYRPRAFPMYARCLDLLVLSTYCQGLTDRVAEPFGTDEA